MEVLAHVIMWGLMVFYFISHLLIIRRANRMPDMPDYPPKSWDNIQKWIEGPKCFPAIIIYLVAGSIFAWLIVK